MNKKTLISAVSVIVILAGVTFVYFTYFRPESGKIINEPAISEQNYEEDSQPSSTSSGNTSVESDPSVDKLLSAFGTIGEQYTLHSQHYQQGDVVSGDFPDLGWNGTMILTVNSAKISEYSSEVDKAEPWDKVVSQMNDPCILTLNLSLVNKDAEQAFGVKYQFSALLFQLGAYQDLLPENMANPEYMPVGQTHAMYESFFDKHGDGDQYYQFSITEGESMDFTIKYLIERSFLEQKDPFMYISPGGVISLGVHLNEILESDDK